MRIGSEVADNLMAERLLVSHSGRGQVIGPSKRGTPLQRALGQERILGLYLVCRDAIHEGLSYALTCDRTHHQVWEAPFYGHKQIQNRSLKWIV
jgi:hypothetical protein